MGYAGSVVKGALGAAGKGAAEGIKKHSGLALGSMAALALAYAGSMAYDSYRYEPDEQSRYVLAEGQTATQMERSKVGDVTDLFKVPAGGVTVKITADPGRELVGADGKASAQMELKVMPNSSKTIRLSERKAGSSGEGKPKDVKIRGWSTPITDFDPQKPWMSHLSLVRSGSDISGLVNDFDLPASHNSLTLSLPLIPAGKAGDPIGQIEFKVSTGHPYKALLKAPAGAKFATPDGNGANVWNYGTVDSAGTQGKNFTLYSEADPAVKWNIRVNLTTVKVKEGQKLEQPAQQPAQAEQKPAAPRGKTKP